MASSCKPSRTGGLWLAIVLLCSLAGGVCTADRGTKHSEGLDVTRGGVGKLFGVDARGYEAPLFTGTELPEPPRQGQPWTPPPSQLAPAFVSAAAWLFDHGLPDPRGCEYREVLVGRPALFWDHKLEVPRWEHGWLLPRRHDAVDRFAIGWDGVLRPVFRVGKKVSLRQDAERFLASLRVPPDEPLRACLLLRLGEPELAARYWPDGRGSTRGTWLYYHPAAEWVSSLFIAAVHSHIRGDDHLALIQLRKLAAMRDNLEAEAARRKVPSLSETGNAYFYEFQRVPVLLLDQERRALGLGTLPAYPELTQDQGRIYWRIRDLEQVDVQAPGLDNPGFPDLEKDPLVQALVREGAPAVEPLLRCMENDTRLTRSVAYWRFYLKNGEMMPADQETVMVPVAGAASLALAEILGPEKVQKLLSKVPDSIWALPWQTRNRRLAAIIRAYWWTLHPELTQEDTLTVVNFDLENVTVREALEALFRDRKSIAYILDPAVPDVRITVRCQGLTFPAALRLFARTVQEQVPNFRYPGRPDSTHYMFIMRGYSP